MKESKEFWCKVFLQCGNRDASATDRAGYADVALAHYLDRFGMPKLSFSNLPSHEELVSGCRFEGGYLKMEKDGYLLFESEENRYSFYLPEGKDWYSHNKEAFFEEIKNTIL